MRSVYNTTWTRRELANELVVFLCEIAFAMSSDISDIGSHLREQIKYNIRFIAMRNLRANSLNLIKCNAPHL